MTGTGLASNADLAQLLAALPDPAAETELLRQIGRDMYERGHNDGYAAGVTAMATAYKRWLLGEYDHAEIERRRWHVCCRRCRREGHRDGCMRCENRTRDTYSDPHVDDYVPGQTRLEAAS